MNGPTSSVQQIARSVKERSKFFVTDQHSSHSEELKVDVVDIFPTKTASANLSANKFDNSNQSNSLDYSGNVGIHQGRVSCSSKEDKSNLNSSSFSESTFAGQNKALGFFQAPHQVNRKENMWDNQPGSNLSTPLSFAHTDKDRDSTTGSNEHILTNEPKEKSEIKPDEGNPNEGDIDPEHNIAVVFNKLSDNLEKIFAREYALIAQPFDGMVDQNNELRALCFEIQDETEQVRKKQRKALDIVGNLSSLVSNVASTTTDK